MRKRHVSKYFDFGDLENAAIRKISGASSANCLGPNTAGIPAISEAMRGKPPSEELYTRAAEIASESCSPTTDNRGTAEYKRHLAGELTRRSLRLAVERIRAGAAGDQQRKG